MSKHASAILGFFLCLIYSILTADKYDSGFAANTEKPSITKKIRNTLNLKTFSRNIASWLMMVFHSELQSETIC